MTTPEAGHRAEGRTKENHKLSGESIQELCAQVFTRPAWKHGLNRNPERSLPSSCGASCEAATIFRLGPLRGYRADRADAGPKASTKHSYKWAFAAERWPRAPAWTSPCRWLRQHRGRSCRSTQDLCQQRMACLRGSVCRIALNRARSALGAGGQKPRKSQTASPTCSLCSGTAKLESLS